MTTSRLRVPPRLESWHTQILPLVAEMLDQSSTSITCDAAQLKFAMPIGLCGIAAACHSLHEQAQSVRFENLTGSMENYLERMDVFGHCHIQHRARIRRSNLVDSLVELKCLSRPSEIPDIANSIVVALTGQMMEGQDDSDTSDGMRPLPSERLGANLNYVFSELLENALTHGRARGYGSARVWVAANYLPKSHQVRIGVVDTGCGFLNSLQGHERVRRNPTHAEAIAAALEPYVSCNRAVGILDDSSNQGIGLTVSAQIARAAAGWVELNSGNTSLREAWHRTVSRSPNCSWQGAALDVVMSRDKLLDLDLTALIRPYQRDPRPNLRFE